MLYKTIKREMDSQMGIISQVLITGKASGMGRAGAHTNDNFVQQYAANVALKVRSSSHLSLVGCFWVGAPPKNKRSNNLMGICLPEALSVLLRCPYEFFTWVDYNNSSYCR